MTWARSIAVASVGFLFIVAGLALALVPGDAIRGSAFATFLVVFVAFVALIGTLWKVRGRLDETSERPVSWATESFATPAPERTSAEYPLSSDDLADVIAEAGARARSAGTVEDGIAVVRPPLRDALGTALVQGGRSGDEVRRALAAGEWTDDQVAASVLDGGVDPPEQSLRERLRAWLFPERVVHRRSQRAMQAVAEAIDEALPTVPGQTAPRTVPVVRPRLEELRRSAGGHLQRAVDPAAVARGPRPPEPDLDGATDGNTRGKPSDGTDLEGASNDGLADAPPTGNGPGDGREDGSTPGEVSDT